MRAFTTELRARLDGHPRARQWLWFAALWLAGLATAAAVAWPLKLLVRSLG